MTNCSLSGTSSMGLILKDCSCTIDPDHSARTQRCFFCFMRYLSFVALIPLDSTIPALSRSCYCFLWSLMHLVDTISISLSRAERLICCWGAQRLLESTTTFQIFQFWTDLLQTRIQTSLLACGRVCYWWKWLHVFCLFWDTFLSLAASCSITAYEQWVWRFWRFYGSWYKTIWLTDGKTILYFSEIATVVVTAYFLVVGT